jgi:hypothetical protein
MQVSQENSQCIYTTSQLKYGTSQFEKEHHELKVIGKYLLPKIQYQEADQNIFD